MPDAKFDLIAFDADDTLWHNEVLYNNAQAKFKQLLIGYHSMEWIEQRLYQTEMRNLEHFGYGIKAFTLSMIETAIELTEGRIQGSEIQHIIDVAKEMLNAEIPLLDNVKETIARLSSSYDLMIITKGDLLDQEAKIKRSGIGEYFKYIEILSNKTIDSYRAILVKYHIEAAHFMMIGNSLKSDILPVVELGGNAVYIPYHLTWAHENEIEDEASSMRYYELEHIGLLPELIEKLTKS